MARRSFSCEFNLEAVRLVSERGKVACLPEVDDRNVIRCRRLHWATLAADLTSESTGEHVIVAREICE